MKAFVGAVTLVTVLTGSAVAQTMPNTGPAGNPNVDSFGKVYSGARPLPTKQQRYKKTLHQHSKIKWHRGKRLDGSVTAR
jgi:hypothetical protein